MNNKSKYESYIDSHKAVVNPAPTTNKQQNSNMLISKINAHMLMNCEKTINQDQIKVLQKYKTNAEKFDSSKDGYRQLVDVDLS